MANFKTGGIYSKLYTDGETDILDLVTKGCEGYIAGESDGAGLTLAASNDKVNTFGSQVITTPAAFEAIGPFKFLHVTAAGNCYLRFQ